MPDGPLSIDNLKQEIVASGLLSADELQATESSFTSAPESAEDFARRLVDAGTLTLFQASSCLKRKGSDLGIGPYVILESIGSGGMGQVYRARHGDTDEIVALKVLPPKQLGSRSAVKRFEREIGIARRTGASPRGPGARW